LHYYYYCYYYFYYYYCIDDNHAVWLAVGGQANGVASSSGTDGSRPVPLPEEGLLLHPTQPTPPPPAVLDPHPDHVGGGGVEEEALPLSTGTGHDTTSIVTTPSRPVPISSSNQSTPNLSHASSVDHLIVSPTNQLASELLPHNGGDGSGSGGGPSSGGVGGGEPRRFTHSHPGDDLPTTEGQEDEYEMVEGR